jgi:nitroreductase
MDVHEAIRDRRTIRRFCQASVSREVLERIVDAGRMAPSAGNRQPVRYVVVAEAERCAEMFEQLAWLAAAGRPPEEARPAAYIVVLGDTSVNASYQSDCAAAVQNMQLAAWAEGLGCCWIGSVTRSRVSEMLSLPPHIEIYAVVAVGWPAEQPAEEEAQNGTAAYRDEQGVLRVPKLSLGSVMRFEKWG